MKFLILLLIFLTIISLSFSNKNQDYQDCIINQKVIGEWIEGDGSIVTQYKVEILNNSTKIIKSIIISTDYTLCLNDVTSIWNIDLLSNGDLILPSSTLSIPSYGNHTFFFILYGTEKANLLIKSIIYE